MLIPGEAGTVASIQGAALPPVAGVLMLSAYMLVHTWFLLAGLCMPSFQPRAQAALPTTLSERQLFAIQRQELEARVLEIERRTQASNLVTLRTDIKAMMQDMIKYSLTEFGVIPKANPPQSRSQSTSVDKETP